MRSIRSVYTQMLNHSMQMSRYQIIPLYYLTYFTFNVTVPLYVKAS